jgi:hypothetical protein
MNTDEDQTLKSFPSLARFGEALPRAGRDRTRLRRLRLPVAVFVAAAVPVAVASAVDGEPEPAATPGIIGYERKAAETSELGAAPLSPVVGSEPAVEEERSIPPLIPEEDRSIPPAIPCP